MSTRPFNTLRAPIAPSLLTAAEKRGIPLERVEEVLARGKCVHRVEYWASGDDPIRVVFANGRAVSCYDKTQTRAHKERLRAEGRPVEGYSNLTVAEVNADIAADPGPAPIDLAPLGAEGDEGPAPIIGDRGLLLAVALTAFGLLLAGAAIMAAILGL